MTSVFLARELGLRVWANDLWVSPDDSWKLICEAGQQGSVCPIRAEAHDLPYAAGFFDAVLSVDSYQYYGTDDIYLGYITRFLAPGGTLGLVMPALMQEIEGEPPEHLTRPGASGTPFWDPRECWCFHTVDWWRRHLERTGLVDVEVAENVKDGWRLWRDWELIRNGGGFSGFPSEAETLDADRGEHIGFVLLVARRCAAPAGGHVDHSLRVRL
jgi:SAM-dependent methyltransferase